MKTKSIIAKLNKHGIKLKIDSSNVGEVTVNGHVLSVRDQNGDASSVHVRRVGDNHNSITGYFAGQFCPTLRSLVSVLNLPR